MLLMATLGDLNANVVPSCINIACKTYRSFLRSTNVVSDEKIIKLSKMSDTYKGTQAVKNYIGRLNLPSDVMEDTYLRIAVYQNKINRNEAEAMFTNLKGKEGFRSTLSKIIGNNPQGVSGHMNELRIANEAAKSGFQVVGIGKKFDDGIKNSLTDIDVIFKKGDIEILMEAKKYSPTTKMPLDKFRADLDTLNSYSEKFSEGSKSIKVFSFTEKPESLELLKQYQFWADKKGVQLIFGNAEEQIIQIEMLRNIL